MILAQAILTIWLYCLWTSFNLHNYQRPQTIQIGLHNNHSESILSQTV